MEFKEFTEFSNPLEADYDINRSLPEDRNTQVNPEREKYIIEITNMIGFLEDNENPMDYGITWEEYFNPNRDVVNKVRLFLSKKETEREKSR